MIRELRQTDTDRISEIWLDTNLRAHDFIPAEYWEGNFDNGTLYYGKIKQICSRTKGEFIKY